MVTQEKTNKASPGRRRRDIYRKTVHSHRVAERRNAASIAGLMIITEAMVAEAPKNEAPDSGGMGGMNF